MMKSEDLQKMLVETLKRWVGIVPVALEILLTLAGMYLVHAALTRARAIRHSCFDHKVWRVHRERELPRDMLAGKFFQNPYGLWIHYRVWNDPSNTKPKGMIMLVHGMSEHIDRHGHTAEFYVEKGYFVVGIDHQGFGRSEGDRAHVERFDHYCEDMLYFLGTFLPERFPELAKVPKFIQAHSMGSMISFHTAIQAQNSTNPWHKLSGLILGNGMLNSERFPFRMQLIFTMLSFVRPKWELFNFPSAKSTNFLAAKQQSFFDPVNWAGGLRPHQLLQVLTGEKRVASLAKELKTPTYLFHGTKDLTTDPEGSRALYRAVKAQNPDADITLNELEGMYHEPLQEEKAVREPVLEQIEAWIAERAERANQSQQ